MTPSKIYLQNQIEKLDDFYPPGTTAEDIISPDKNLKSTSPSLTDEDLIGEVIHGLNGDNEEDDDVMFGMHGNCCMTTYPSLETVKTFNKSPTHLH